jgi:two-component system, chemotaxis family, CheB/CheR fusion protein
MPPKKQTGTPGGRRKAGGASSFSAPNRTTTPPVSNRSVAEPMIVGLGASAGGLSAFKTFFESMPATSGMAFVLVQHLSPDHKSMLADILSKPTTMPVRPGSFQLDLAWRNR